MAAKKAKSSSSVKRLAVKAAVFAAAVFILLRFVIGVSICSGAGMFPALLDGDLVVFSRLQSPRQGDIAAYLDPRDGRLRFSRVIGLEGCEIDITELGELKTNGYIPPESIFYRTEKTEGSSVVFPLTVGKGQVFLLDDYRTLGEDSRIFGTVGPERVKGKVIYVIRRRGF